MPGGADSNFCLRWNDFETNVSAAFRELRADRDFFDITLACDASGGKTLQAHKVILSACSAFFKQMLKQQQAVSGVKYQANGHAPFIYLRGVRYRDMEALLDFMYHGEVNVAQEELSGFLAVAEDLQVKGLTQAGMSKELAGHVGSAGTKRGAGRGGRPSGSGAKRAKPSTVTLDDLESSSSIVKNEPLGALETTTDAAETFVDDTAGAAEAFGESYGDDTTTYTYEDGSGAAEAIAVEEQQMMESGSADKVTDFNDLVHGLLTFENGIHTCNLCGKKSPWRTTMLRHVEANHVETTGHVCDICGNVSKTRHAFNMHKKRMHENKDPDQMSTPKKPRKTKGSKAAAAAAGEASVVVPAEAVAQVEQQVVQQVVITTADGQQIVQQQQF